MKRSGEIRFRFCHIREVFRQGGDALIFR